MLLRNFIGKRLAAYYAQSENSVVGTAFEPIQFNRLWGEYHWKRVLNRLYSQDDNGHWFTPVELFRPYYSNVLANCIAQHCHGQVGGTVDIVEFGAGRGTNAITVLDHLKATEPELYERVQYTILDASPTLHKLQRERLSATPHSKKVSYIQKDLISVTKGRLLPPSENLTFVMALEVLDNLPHDKILRTAKGLQQGTVIRNAADTEWKEKFQPLKDPVLKEILHLAPGYASSKASWIPSIALATLHQLPQSRPNAQLLLTDFDWFPPDPPNLHPEAPPRRSQLATDEPLIKAMDNYDYACYLSAPLLSDILFPTNFNLIKDFLKRSWKNLDRDITVRKQSEFLLEYGPEEANQTKSWLTGYSPMIHDYSNCSVLTATIPRWS